MVLTKNSRFVAYAGGLFFDRLGNSIYMVILPLLIYAKSQSLWALTLAILLQVLPKVFSFLLVGPLLDGMNRKKIFFQALIVQSVVSFLMGVLCYFESSVSAYLFLATVMSVAFDFSRNCERTLVPLMFPQNIPQATSLLASVFSICCIVGPLLIYLIPGKENHAYLLYFNSATFLAPIFFSRWSKIPNYIPPERLERTRDIFLSLKKGFHYTWSEGPMRIMLLVAMGVSFATLSSEPIIVYLLKNNLGQRDQVVSLLFLFEGSGMFLASMISAKCLGEQLNMSKLIKISLVTLIMAMMLLLQKSVYTLIIGFMGVAMSMFFFSLFFEIYLQQKVKTEYLGRVNSFFRMSRQLGGSLSLLIIPSLFTPLGQQGIFLFMMGLLAIILGLFQKYHRRK